MNAPGPSENSGGYASFPTTHWSVVYRAGGSPVDAKALEKLLTDYLPALRLHLVAARRVSPTDVEDLLQGFVVDRMMQQEMLGNANQGKGRFRTYLLAVLDNYLFNVRRYNQARKRSPDGPVAQVDQHPLVDSSATPPSHLVDIAWARQVIQNAVQRMRLECEKKGRLDIWEIFRLRIYLPSFEQQAAVSYEDLVTQLNLRSPREAYVLLNTAKRMFGKVLHDEVAQYTRDEQELEEEINDLRSIVSKTGA